MDVIIKDMDVPSCCEVCDLRQYVGNRTISGMGSKALYNCPFCTEAFTLNRQRQEFCRLEPASK